MADEQASNEVQDTSEQQAKGTPEGVRNKDLSDGHAREGNPAPKVNNEPPVKELTAEEKTAADKKTADDKAAADKTAADAEAAKKTADAPAEFTVYNHEAADSAINTLKEAGVTPAEAKAFFSKAIESGNLADIDKAALVAKVGKDKATLVLAGVEKYYNDVAKETIEMRTAAYVEVGGEVNFKTVATWAAAKEQTDPAFKKALDAYRGMLYMNTVAAKLAAKELKAAYNADPNNKTLDTNMVQGDKAGNAEATQGISRAEYITKLKVAEAKGDKAEVARLNAARLAGKKAKL